jgi:hypothetical protein
MLAPAAEGDIMTLTEKWFQQGETKGREEGRERRASRRAA